MNSINKNDTKQMELYPDVRDGLTSVQRRILWALRTCPKKEWNRFMKSARIVGSVMGRFYPYNDDCIYKALVNMVQLTEKTPLVFGQGNFGSPADRNSYAAMRFTEVMLSPWGKSMFDRIENGAVELFDNYDGCFKEPRCLPSMFPNLLVNGFEGEHVSVPPHDFLDVIAYVRDYCNGASQSNHPLLDESRTFPIWTGEKVEKLSFAQMLGIWVEHRVDCLERSFARDVKEANEKMHWLDAKKMFLKDLPANLERRHKFKSMQEFGASMGFDEVQNRYFEKMTFRDIATSDIDQEISLAESELAGLQKTLNSREALLGIILEQLESLANPSRKNQKKV